ncbi:endoglucanase 18-like [Phragmites australis]|uniref:endoglucanase 18-like n=1 Tax=Phragmites australis TaxID=29695 RepID=UPI002D786A7C|nr:endoglucanase 18-like [Phragmites australis]
MAHCCGCSVRCCCWLLVLTLLALAVTAAVVFVRIRNGGQVFPLPGLPDHKYAEALGVALQFFQVQKSGKLVNNGIPWRGDSALDDGKEAGLDLSKGMYDAGDHMKFGFTMAFTGTMLSWSVLEYGEAMRAAKQRDAALDALQWIMDFLVSAHPSDDVLYIQVGDPKADHKCWERPETMAEKRPLTKITAKSPGSDVAAETAAAMAAASLVYKPINGTYSSSLVDHAERLFAFADKYRGAYTRTFPELSAYYNSTTYQDELLWAASWLYHATGNRSYLSYATGKNGKEFADLGNPRYFSWDDKRAGTEVLLSRVSFFASHGSDVGQDQGLLLYKQTADAVMCILLPDSDTAAFRTEGGLLYVADWNSLQHPVASAFLAAIYSDYMLTSGKTELTCSGKSFTAADLRKFAKSQADYVLGDNPMKLSYLVGYGDSYPQQVHHRGASIPADVDTGCDGQEWLKSSKPNPNVAAGALVGGPFKNDSFVDNRENVRQNEATTYNSALIVGLLSSLISSSNVAQSLS